MLGGNNYEEQCLKVPDILENSIHAMHPNPCYKKQNSENEAESSRAKRNKSDNSGTNLFPDTCYFCKKKKKERK